MCYLGFKIFYRSLDKSSTSVLEVDVSGQSGTGSGRGIVLIFWWISTILSWTSLGKTDGLSHGLGGGLGIAPGPVPFASSLFNPCDIWSSFSLIWSKLPWLSSTKVFRHLALEAQETVEIKRLTLGINQQWVDSSSVKPNLISVLTSRDRIRVIASWSLSLSSLSLRRCIKVRNCSAAGKDGADVDWWSLLNLVLKTWRIWL